MPSSRAQVVIRAARARKPARLDETNDDGGEREIKTLSYKTRGRWRRVSPGNEGTARNGRPWEWKL